ncbi:hypothetical protein AB0N07_14895 [Streptomyces sp. NPDC051172]|uniref:hypothetical protein n=1 Tax=Streptomyces sp. NPDC051172 TaxID=3155796 RepID=UPI00343DC6C0
MQRVAEHGVQDRALMILRALEKRGIAVPEETRERMGDRVSTGQDREVAAGASGYAEGLLSEGAAATPE